MTTRDEVVREARSWVGVPWQHQGRTRLGIDCAGLIIVVAKALEIADYDTTAYQRRTHGTDFLQHFRDNMTAKQIVRAVPGDVLLFRDQAYPCHSSIVGDRNGAMTIIHAHAMRREVVEELIDQGPWLVKRVACFEFKGLET